MNEVKGGIVRRIAVQMKQRQCRHVAHVPSIFEPVIDSYGGGKGEAPHDRAGLPNSLSRFTAGLAAADQASAARPAAVGHLGLASAGRLAVGHPVAVGRASGLDSDSSFFPLKHWFATSIARFPWQASIRGQCIRSRIHIEAMYLELALTFRVPLCNRENRRWDAICFCGCLGCRYRFWR
jgi:hypothetical protein